MPAAVVTAKGLESCAITLAKLRLGGWFDEVCCNPGRADSKTQALVRLSVLWRVDVAEMLVVGDTSGDRSAARAVGARFVGMHWQARCGNAGAEVPEWITADFGELESWLVDAVDVGMEYRSAIWRGGVRASESRSVHAGNPKRPAATGSRQRI